MKRIHKKGEPAYRPYHGNPFKKARLLMAAELNKTSLHTFDDLSIGRHADYELWKRIFPGIPFPADADALRTPYHKDPGV